jgi:hypothetical protein
MIAFLHRDGSQDGPLYDRLVAFTEDLSDLKGAVAWRSF